MFIKEKIYRRGKLHDEFGGNRQSGICNSVSYNLIFLFMSERGLEYGYHDKWTDKGTLLYCGEGQKGDMVLKRGNLAIKDHVVNRKDLYLFKQTQKGYVKYIDQMLYVDHHFEEGLDREKKKRKIIVFELLPFGSFLDDYLFHSNMKSDIDDKISFLELRNLAYLVSNEDIQKTEIIAFYQKRSSITRNYVLRRAKGICEGCGKEAPFLTKEKKPFLEVHHIHRLSDGGPDNPEWVIALCPNCHRKAHYAFDSNDFNDYLKSNVEDIESNI